LILLGLKLSNASGLQFLQQIKSHCKYRRTPVIIISGSTQKADIDAAYSSHAAAFIGKPRTKNESARLRRALESFWFELASFPGRPPTEREPRIPTVKAPRLMPFASHRFRPNDGF
ncbi:MAG: response regulator, partial [Myxococcota bacterium]